MASPLTERFRFFSPAQDKEPFHVIGFRGEEGLHRLFDFQIDLVCADAAVDTGALLASPCRFEVMRDGDADPAVFSGYPAAVEQRGFFNGYAYYAVRLRPTFWKLSQIRQSAIFLDKKLEDVLRELMASQPFFSFPHEFRLTAQDYPVPEFAMQYQETLYDYMCWRMEEQGAYFYFEEKNGTDTVIFADAPQSHSTADAPRLSYSPASGLEGDLREEVIVSFALTRTPLPRRVVLRNYDWRNPNKPVVGMADVDANGLGDVYLSNEYVENDNEANRLAAIRAQELRCRGRLFHGASSAPVLRPGRIFRLERHYGEPFNRDYLVTEITHEGRQDAFLSLGLGIPLREPGERLYYRNTFTCMEADVPYRPARTAPRTHIPGVLRAFVAGDSSGARAEMDEYGRYKLTFPFDVSGRSGGNASCWIRRAQAQVGKDSGLGLPLLPGTEVLVSFVDGNPDLPVIGGALANGETGSISGAGNANFQGLRSPGGNQITINDADKKQGISLSTPTGSGLTIAAGSTESALLHSGQLAEAAGTGFTQLASFGLSQFSGFKTSSGAYRFDHKAYWPAFIAALSSTASSVMDTLADGACKKDENKLKWEASGVKTLATALNALGDLLVGLDTPPLAYGGAMLAQDDLAKTLLQVSPSSGEMLSAALPYFSARLGSLASNSVEVAKKSKAADASDEKRDSYIDALRSAMAALYAADQTTYATYEQPDTSEACSKYETVDGQLETAIGTCAPRPGDTEDEAAKKSGTKENLENCRQTLKSTYANFCTDENIKEEGENYYDNQKNTAGRSYLVETAGGLIPEIVSLILFYRGYLKKKRLGGILLRAKDRNITMTAQDAIAMHAQRGMLRNTRDLPRADATLTTEAMGAQEQYAASDRSTEDIGVISPYGQGMDGANSWGVQVATNAHATDFMREIDALSWHIKTDDTPQRGDYIRKRATFLADTTELEFRRNRWSYQRSEENARITADRQLTFTSGPSAIALQHLPNRQKIALLLGTQHKQGRIILRSQASDKKSAATQALFTPTSLAVTCKAAKAKKPSTRLDMKDALATMTTKEATLVLETDTACLEGKGSKVTCSAKGIALEPANGKISLADIVFSGSEIKGARSGILTLAGGAIKITGANATVEELGDAPVQAAEDFVRQQEEAVSDDQQGQEIQALFAEDGQNEGNDAED